MRKLKDNILSFLLYLSAFATVGLLVLIVGFIFIKGIKGISLDYIFSDYSASGDGGIFPMILSTLYMVLVSIAVSTPIGILSAIYLNEYGHIRVEIIRLSGNPSIENIFAKRIKTKVTVDKEEIIPRVDGSFVLPERRFSL